METKNPLTIGIIAVFAVAVVAALFGGSEVTGHATYIPVRLDFPVYAESANRDCGGISASVDWTVVDNFCRSKGYSGALPVGGWEGACLFEHNAPTRYYWDGSIPMSVDMEQVQNTAGLALVDVNCVP